MPFSAGVKSRWLTDKETDNLSQIIHNFFIKSANIIVSLRNKRQHSNDNNDKNTDNIDSNAEHSNKCLADLDGNVSSLHGHNNITDSLSSLKLSSKSLIKSTSQRQQHQQHQQQQQQQQQQDKLKPDIWFNIKTFNNDVPKKDLLPWYNKDVTALPPMIVETVLDLNFINDNNLKLYINDDIINTKKKSEIVLERWLIKLELDNYDNDSIELPIIYKKSIVLFRCLYTLMRLLPSSKLLYDNILTNNIKIKTKILNGSKALTSKGRFGLSRALIPDKPDMDIVESKDLLPVITPIGSLNLSVSYRKNCNFYAQFDEIYDNKNTELINEIHKNTNEEIHLTDTDLPQIPNNLNTETSLTKLSHSKEASHVTANTINNSDYSTVSPIGNVKFRASSTSINSLSSKRRMSVRSVSIFKTGSMASSSSPPNMNILHNNSVSPNQIITSSYANSNPIPVNRTDLTSSAHFYNNNTEKNESNTNLASTLITSTSGKFTSSYGSRFRNGSSRNNSLEGYFTVGNNNSNFTPSSNPILQNFKSRNKFITSSFSDIDPNNSLYLDDDLNNFMKLLDSKPDLRILNNSSIVLEDSLSNFKSLKKNNDLFNGSPLKESLSFSRSSSSSSPSKPPPLIRSSDQKYLDSTVQLLLDNKQNLELENERNRRFTTSAPINVLKSQNNNNNDNHNMNFGSLDRYTKHENISGRVRTNSRDSRGSRESYNSRNSTGIIPGPLITSSSYSPKSNIGTSGQISHSIHSILKATATSGTSGEVATGINIVTQSNEINNDNIDNNINEKKRLSYDSEHNFENMGTFDKISPSSNYSVLPRSANMNRSNSIAGRAQSLLRSFSVSSGNTNSLPGPGYIYQQPKSRTTSGGSISGSHLRHILNSNLKNVTTVYNNGTANNSDYSNNSGNSSNNKNDNNNNNENDNKIKTYHRHNSITSEQLKAISYGQEVFESEDDIEYDKSEEDNISETKIRKDKFALDNGSVNKPRVSFSEDVNDINAEDRPSNRPNEFAKGQRSNRNSLNTILNNLKNIQRRQNSHENSRKYQHLRLKSKSAHPTFHSDDTVVERDNHQGNNDEDDEDDEDDLLFEMSDMATIK